MLKRLLFPMGGFLLLSISVVVSPRQASADPCNNKFCLAPPGGEQPTCQPQINGPTSDCFDIGQACTWDRCNTPE